MKVARMWAVMVVLALAGCGVPRLAGVLAREGAGALAVMPTDEAGVRAALLGQADSWTRLAGLLRLREMGGIGGVEPGFVELMEEAAALARRQRVLIEAGGDDPALNRAALEKLRALWADASRYLNQ